MTQDPFDADKFNVKGIAVKSGISRNGIKYTPGELQKFSMTMPGVSIIKDHKAEVDNTVGVVETALFQQGHDSVAYDGWIKDKALAERIRDGRVKHVSIGAICGKLVKENEDSDHLIAKDMQCCELSTVVVPGVPGATIQQSLAGKGVLREDVDTFNQIPIFQVHATESSNENLLEKKEESITMTEEVKESKLSSEEMKELEELRKMKEELEIEKRVKEEVERRMKEVTEVKETTEPVKEDMTKGEVKEEKTTETISDHGYCITREEGIDKGFAFWKDPGVGNLKEFQERSRGK